MQRRISLVILFICALTLSGCQRAPVEKLYSLENRETQLTQSAADDRAENKNWDMQKAEEIMLPSDREFINTNNATAHFFDASVRITQVQWLDGNDVITYTVQEAASDGFIDVTSFSLPYSETTVISPDGSKVLYSVSESYTVSLYMMDIFTEETRLIWQSPDLLLLYELGLSFSLHCQWSSKSSSFVFMPIPIIMYSYESNIATNSDQEISEMDSAIQAFIENSSEFQDLFYLYTYQLTSDSLSSYFIFPESYPLYSPEGFSLPYIASNDDGTCFLVYPNSFNTSNAYYINIDTDMFYGMSMPDDLPGFTYLGSPPIYYDGLWYLHVQDVGIMVVDLDGGDGLIATYPFNDPIQAYTIFEDTLIVAQPVDGAQGVDVTAYLLNQESKNSVLLYHSDTANPYVTHMEITQLEDGLCLLIELTNYDINVSRKLILLNF